MLPDPILMEQSVEELFDNAPCGFLSTLPDGTIVQVNKTFVTQTGQTREHLLSGKRFPEMLTLPGRMYFETHFDPLLKMQGFVKEVTLDMLRKDRESLPILVNALQKTGLSGGPTLTLITVFDATDRRKYEHELLLARRRAEQSTISERLAREESERLGRVKDEFLATVSHELRTPLNAIVGWTSILRDEGGLTPEQNEGLQIIARNAKVQGELISDLMDMSRIIAGKMRLNVQEVKLSDVIEAAVDTSRPAADGKGLRLQKVLDPTIIVSGDPGRLQQVMWNLLTNAIKFTPRGGFVRLLSQRINSHVEISVSDSGQGMSPEFLDHAFERFRQSDAGETQKTSGLGLGLSIVKNIVEMHGGSVHAMSDGPGKGSNFIIKLPLAVVHSPDDGQRVHPHAAIAGDSLEMKGKTLHGIKILLVDDERDGREAVRRVLAASGAEVQTASTASEALHILGNWTPQVLVSDIGMPKEDGYDLIRKVRMLGEGNGRVAAVALTAFDRVEDRTRAMLAGFQMHLSKPVDARELIVTVAALAGR